MRSKLIFLFLTTILLASCAAPTQQATVIPQTSEASETPEVLMTATPTQAPTSMPTSTTTPEPAKVNAPPFSPEVTAALEKNGLSVAPEDLCLWEGTEGATVQCLTLNPEAVPELKSIFSKLSHTVAWLDTWSVYPNKPGKYRTLAQYEAMLAAQPLQSAKDMALVWHPDNIRLSNSGGAWQKTSEWEVDGERIGNDALIDTNQVGIRLEDWHEVKDEGGWIVITGNVRIKQAIEPVEDQEGVWRVVWRIARMFTKTEAMADPNEGDYESTYGILMSDPTLSVGENAAAYNYAMRWIQHVQQVAEANPETALWKSGSGTAFMEFAQPKIKMGRDEMVELHEGTEFFGAGQ